MFDLMPFNRKENNLFDYFDNFEKNFFGDMTQGISAFRTDVIDDGDNYIVKAELPGFDKNDINIGIEGNNLTISAQRNEENEDKKDNYIYKERRYGSFARSFDVSNIKSNEITADYKNGILSLNLPKREEAVPQSHRIEIK